MTAAHAMPSLFISHGAPTLALETGPAQDFLRGLGREVGRPRAILCVSAHWETTQPEVTAAARPSTIRDFHGFPRALYEIEYPAPGDPELARRIVSLLRSAGLPAATDEVRGLDHGAWVPLVLMYPDADVPVLQLSLQTRSGAEHHLRVGQALAPLRDEGMLVLASGGSTHNLRDFHGQSRETPPYDYVRAFEDWLCEAVEAGDTGALLAWTAAPQALRNHPTPEHFLPLLVALGAAARPTGRALYRGFEYGMLAMAAFAWN